MSGKNGKGSGRWDHLLREIPTEPTRQTKSATLPLEEVQPSLLSEPMPEPESETQSPAILKVSEINNAIKRQLEGEFGEIWLQGEISNFKNHSSGHWYFSLKDEKSQINAVMFRGFNNRIKFNPDSGMEVIVRGKVTVYEPRGNYQIFCEFMEPVGAGALQQAYEQLKKKLLNEGLFDPKHKKAIPPFPKRIGVVTSPTGAAIQDILNVLKRRSRRAQVVVIPARVQGDSAAAEVARGIELANQVKDFDVLIVGRGGGSLEDLWCFNEEVVARAIFQSKIPIISAVGHEVDTTISDYVADMRAPTPSAAAELVAQSEQELQEKLKFYSRSLRLLCFQKLQDLKQRITYSQSKLIDPRRYLQDCMLRLDDWTTRLNKAILNSIERQRMQVKLKHQALKSPLIRVEKLQDRNKNLSQLLLRTIKSQLQNSKSRFQSATGLLDSLSPLRVVERGFAIVRSDGKLVPDVASLKKNEIEIELRDGFIEAQVKSSRKKETK